MASDQDTLKMAGRVGPNDLLSSSRRTHTIQDDRDRRPGNHGALWGQVSEVQRDYLMDLIRRGAAEDPASLRAALPATLQRALDQIVSGDFYPSSLPQGEEVLDGLARLHLHIRFADLLAGRVRDEEATALPPDDEGHPRGLVARGVSRGEAMMTRVRSLLSGRGSPAALSRRLSSAEVVDMAREGKTEALPPLYQRFFLARDARGHEVDVNLRTVTLLPPLDRRRGTGEPEVRFRAVNVGDLGDGILSDPWSVRRLLQMGYGAHLMDLPNHGLSDHLDPRNSHQREMSALTQNVALLTEESDRIARRDPRFWQEGDDALVPRMGIGTGAGARHLVDYVAMVGEEHGFEALFLDSLALGPGEDAEFRAGARFIHGAVRSRHIGNWVAERTPLHRRKPLGHTLDPDREGDVVRYHRAGMGLPYTPWWAFDTPRFEGELWERLQGMAEARQNPFPRMMLGVFGGDTQIDIGRAVIFALQFGGEGTFVYHTGHHNGRLALGSEVLMADMDLFVRGNLSHNPEAGIHRLDEVAGFSALRDEVAGRGLRTLREIKQIGTRVAGLLDLPTSQRGIRRARGRALAGR